MALRKKYSDSTSIAGKWVVNGVSFMQSAHESKNSIIVEESSALMLDVPYSPYPLITSSDTTLGSIISCLTFNSKNITETIGAVKASEASVWQKGF
ncbi:hypothetical protein LB505_007125 [Fusarium chuoi]|nr:hypothetical protein LB505_007125 [Fusarium chuoi]